MTKDLQTIEIKMEVTLHVEVDTNVDLLSLAHGRSPERRTPPCSRSSRTDRASGCYRIPT